jgi:hypothetical protein
VAAVVSYEDRLNVADVFPLDKPVTELSQRFDNRFRERTVFDIDSVGKVLIMDTPFGDGVLE